MEQDVRRVVQLHQRFVADPTELQNRAIQPQLPAERLLGLAHVPAGPDEAHAQPL
jgi:hypothetical protein